MKFLRQGIALAVATAGLAAAPLLQAAADPAGLAPDSGNAVQKMRDEAGGKVAVSVERSTGRLGFIRAKGNADLMPSREGASSSAAVDKATAYVTKYASAFGAGKGQLTQSDLSKNKYGWTISFKQSYQGVPVFGALLRANVDAQGDLTAVNGFAAPVSGLSVKPGRSASAAAARAIATVRANPRAPGMRPSDNQKSGDLSGLKVESNHLVIYRTGFTRGLPGKSVLAYSVVVSNGRSVRDMLILDASTLKPLNSWSMLDHAIDRHLYEADADRNLTEVWAEGDALPGTLNVDQESMVRSAGDSYWLFSDTFGRDSFDGAGASMLTVNNDPAINCPNANWNGQSTNYCDGVSSDDVVAHEWGHAYTEYTSDLIYQWQPGALNESYSDVWGETVDLVNNRLDEGEGDLTAKRVDGQCSSHSPANPLVTINSPSSIAKDCLTGGASYGAQLDGTGLTNDVVAATDVDEDGATATFTTLDGCSAYDNAAAVVGKFALVNRGGCTFVQKTQVAQAAGAVALIIGNRDNSAISPSGDDPSITIPTVTIGLDDRELIRSALGGAQTVNVTMKDASGTRGDSYRWLMGEKSDAFGGAIRDMWTPTCYGDPGKVSDTEYKCSADDNGGVHGNSGVPNHAYALTVDGGVYNGLTVTGLGLDKAANLWFRAQTAYLVPSSDFGDFADALEASCTDLTGQPINAVSVTENGTPTAAASITAADCAELAKVIAATQLRKVPVQCEFQPLLDPKNPSVCGKGTKRKEIFSEEFTGGLKAWKASNVSVFGGPTYPWEITSDGPGGHGGKVAFVADPSEGDCSGTATDISGSDAITTPAIKLPAGLVKTPRLSFDHYVATELGWDGGNVKISVNGGAFTTVPAAAYTFNAPLSLNTEAQGNTNPLAGQDGFTGSDGGQVTGSWGQSQIDLIAAGVEGGDSIKVRFDFGRDGCGGLTGWYIDNVSVSLCRILTTTAVTADPAEVKTGKSFKAKVTVSADDASVPDGMVKVYNGSTLLGSGTLTAGKVTIKVTKVLKPGKYTLSAMYAGTGTYDASSATFKLKVTK